MAELSPEWAWARMRELCAKEECVNKPQVAFARYIASVEEPPVDPLLVEARRLVECTVHWSPATDRAIASGQSDNTPEVKIALAALKRGMELGRGK